MTYTRIVAELVVRTDDVEVAQQAINDCLDGLEVHTPVFDSKIDTAQADEPQNAEEIAQGRLAL